MTSNETAKHRRSIARDSIAASAAALLAAAVLSGILASPLPEYVAALLGYPDQARYFIYSHLPYVLFVLVAACLLVFGLIFTLLRRREILYLTQITEALQDISEGDFERTVPVVGDDELADLALQLNHMTGEIRVLIEREKEAEQTKNDLITNVAHDLKTPLTVIIGYLDIIRSRPGLDETIRSGYLQIAYDKSKHLQTMIEELFGFTKLGYTQTAHMQKLDLVLLLGQLLDEFYAVMEQKSIDCTFHTNQESVMLEGDPTLLARLFDNLLGNAAKYGQAGKQLRVNLTADEKDVKVAVINYGKVIEPRDLEHIFDKFYRAEQSRNSSTGGTGLGLAIAKNIAEMHGGSIRAESSLEKGTIFEVTLPLPTETEGGATL